MSDASEHLVDPVVMGVPAATLVVFGDDGEDPPLLVTERSAAMRFAPGALAFPGGQVDAGDRALAARFGRVLDPDDAAARIAAIRETLEETGLAVGFDGNDDTAARIRVMLGQGGDFGELMASEGVILTLDALVPFARWNPRLANIKSFDTRFYIARSPCGTGAVSPDGIETAAAWWQSARNLVVDVESGVRSAIFPTHRNLERLASLGSFAAACAQASAIGDRTITPWIERDDERELLCIPSDCGYPVTRVILGNTTRK